MTNLRSINRRSGFSLFEMLMFLAVIGVILGLVVPTLTPNAEFELARNRRNAQEVSVMFSAAQIAGLNFEGPSVNETIRKVMEGGSPTTGIFKNRRFGVGGIRETDIDSVSRHLTLKNGQLIYSPNARS